MTHTNTELPAINELCQWFNEGDGFKQGTAAPHKWVLQANSEISRQHARIAELEEQLSAIGAGGVFAPAAQGMDALNEWEDIRTLPTCDDLIWLYCQDSNTIDGPIAPEPNLEEYGWTHWSYANAPSTAWIDAALAAQAKLNVK